MLESLFNTFTGPQAFNFIKKGLQHRCSSLKFAKSLRIPFFTEQPPEVFYKKGLQASNFIKKRPQQRCFPVNIA